MQYKRDRNSPRGDSEHAFLSFAEQSGQVNAIGAGAPIERGLGNFYKRVVIKIGTSILTDDQGQLNVKHIKKMAATIANLKQNGLEIVIVTSGAIGAGVGKLNLKHKPTTIPEKQAAAAVGQTQLMKYYEEIFAEFGCTIAQVLLTREDMRCRQRYLNARNTILTLLGYKVIPIINENDTVAVEEIKFGDNDSLSAMIASKIEADLLVILSDVEGFFTHDPRKVQDAKLIGIVEEITPELEKQALSTTGSWRGTGGMYTKLQAAKIATTSGVTVIICNGTKANIIEEIFSKENVGTKFLPIGGKISSRKRWIAFGAKICGKIMVDKGAEEVLVNKGRSLLPSGIVNVEGDFKVGDIVAVVNSKQEEIARGLVFYDSKDIDKIKGKKTTEIEKILGYKDYDEVIHRNNLVLL